MGVLMSHSLMESFVSGGRNALVAVAAVVLTACGGGGGGGSSSSDAPAVDLVITQSNAGNVLSDAISNDPLEMVDAIGGGLLRSPGRGGEEITLIDVNRSIMHMVNSSGSGSLARMTRATEAFPCDTGSATISGSESSGTITFNSCSSNLGSGEMVINGTASYTYSGTGDTNFYIGDYSEQATFTYSNFTMSFSANAQSVVISISGSVSFSETYTQATDSASGTVTIPSLVASSGSVQFGTYNFSSTWTDDYVNDVYTWSVDGTYDSTLGTYQVDTLEAFVEDLYGTPSAGKLKIIGVNSSVTVTVLNTTTIQFELDSNGDGQVDATWTESLSDYFY